MPRRWTVRFMLLLQLVLFSSMSQANLLDNLLGSKPKFLPVEKAFPLEASIDEQTLFARFNTSKDYYLYKHQLYIEQNGVKREPVLLSQTGIEKVDEYFGEITAFYGPLDVQFNLSGLQEGTIILHHQGCADAGLCYPPQTQIFELTANNVKALESTSSSTNTVDDSTANNEPQAKHSWFDGKSWWAIAGIFFALGLGLTFTPCVLPMVPILTSVVLGQENDSGKRGFLLSTTYVIGMALTYAAAGVLMGLLGAGANVQMWLQTPSILIVFSILFVVLALSMFGLYELQLPSGIRNKLNNISSRQQGGKWLGVFIMGMLSALIVSPCISAPLAAALVYISSTGDAALGGMALLALGLGMGTPLIALGTTGASILPKAGAWMDQIKIFFGVILLGVAIWLLARILPAPISLTLWAILAITYAVVLGALEPAISIAQRFIKGIGWIILAYGVLALAGALMGNSNPLQPLSLSGIGSVNSNSNESTPPFYRTVSVPDLEQQIKSAPGLVMVDLYADWCISCKIMEKEIFEQADVQKTLANVRWLQLDLTKNEPEHIAYLQKLNLFGPPSILFFHQGKEIYNKRIVGEVTKSEFLSLLPDNTLL